MARDEITASFSVGGVSRGTKVDYPLPPDPHAPPGPDVEGGGDDEVSDYGLNEAIEVGCDCSVADYGIEAGKAGGKRGKNTMD